MEPSNASLTRTHQESRLYGRGRGADAHRLCAPDGFTHTPRAADITVAGSALTVLRRGEQGFVVAAEDPLSREPEGRLADDRG
jgi:hypothetical protein